MASEVKFSGRNEERNLPHSGLLERRGPTQSAGKDVRIWLNPDVIMMKNHPMSIYEKLNGIYRKYQLRHNRKMNSGQMCLMWSTHRLPDVLTETEQIWEIERTFAIDLDEDEAIELYDMTLNDAAEFIKKRVK